jgi:hypothetical protein
MPTLTFASGTSLTWEDSFPQPVTESSALTITPADAPPAEQAPAASPTEADVQAALAKVPPRWTSTALRAGKTLVAGIAAAFAVAWATTGGTWDGVLRDPGTFLTALGTAVLMGAWKYLGWKDA